MHLEDVFVSFSQTTGRPVHGNATIELEIRPTGMTSNYPTIKKKISQVGNWSRVTAHCHNVHAYQREYQCRVPCNVVIIHDI